ESHARLAARRREPRDDDVLARGVDRWPVDRTALDPPAVGTEHDGLAPRAIDVPTHDDIPDLVGRPIPIRDDRAGGRHGGGRPAAIARELVDLTLRGERAVGANAREPQARADGRPFRIEVARLELLGHPPAVEPYDADVALPRKPGHEAVLAQRPVEIQQHAVA